MRFPILLSIKLSPTGWMGARQYTEFSVTSLSKFQAYAALLRGKNTGLIFQTVQRAAWPDQNSKLTGLFPWRVCRVQPASSERSSRLQHSGPRAAPSRTRLQAAEPTVQFHPSSQSLHPSHCTHTHHTPGMETSTRRKTEEQEDKILTTGKPGIQHWV